MSVEWKVTMKPFEVNTNLNPSLLIARFGLHMH